MEGEREKEKGRGTTWREVTHHCLMQMKANWRIHVIPHDQRFGSAGMLRTSMNHDPK